MQSPPLGMISTRKWFELDRLKRPQHVEHAVALEAALAAEVRGTAAQDLFDAARLPDQLGVARHQHRCRTAHVRSGHAGPGLLAPLVRAGLGSPDALAR